MTEKCLTIATPAVLISWLRAIRERLGQPYCCRRQLSTVGPTYPPLMMTSQVQGDDAGDIPWGKIFITKKDGSDHDKALELFDDVSEEDPILFGR